MLLRGLCPDCSKKLNHHSTKREVKKLKKERRKHGKSKNKGNSSPSCSTSVRTTSDSAADDEEFDSETLPGKTDDTEKNVDAMEQQCWTKPLDIEDKSREEEFDDYLEDLLL